jgi:hypothetical protein
MPAKSPETSPAMQNPPLRLIAMTFSSANHRYVFCVSVIKLYYEIAASPDCRRLWQARIGTIWIASGARLKMPD